MRKIATLATPVNGIRRAMAYSTANGTYLFLYTRLEDGPCDFDYWFESPADAEADAAQQFAVRPSDWTVIDEPPPGAQHDWIRPTRVRRDAAGNRLWGQFEPLRPGQ